MDFNWIKTDKFYQGLPKEDQIGLLTTLIKYGHDNGQRHTLSGICHGEIRYCPTCNMTRVTDCIACGCGICYTCDYQFRCLSIGYFSIPGKQIIFSYD